MLIIRGDIKCSIMQTFTRTHRKIIPKMFSRGFVTNEMYLMAGKSLSKFDY